MDSKNITLTEAEWSVMECLWDKSPRIGREITEELEEKMGWSRSTTLTLLRRLEAKGAVADVSEKGIKLFKPIVQKEDAALRETENLLHRAYKGSLSMLVNAFTKRQSLSREEIDELYDILKRAEEAKDNE